jgi:ribonuclease BN (tRNA processing enzyme)
VLLLVLAGLLTACSHRILGQTAGPAPDSPTRATQIVLLGTGTPNAEPDRSGPAIAIIVNQTPYLVDCGPGIVRRAAAARLAGIEALNFMNLKRLFVTHLHSDHTAGLPDLILTPWVLGRDEPLQVYGPPGTREMTDHILRAYQQDIRVRREGLEQANAEGCQVDVHECEPGIIYQDENITVQAIPVTHGSWSHAFGFRFETPDRTIVISGDTTPCESLLESARGCDVLIHEVYSQAGFERRSPKWKRYHAASHTSAPQLAEIAEKTRPGLLILYHQLLWGATEEELLDEIRQIYKGRVVYGKDLAIY